MHELIKNNYYRGNYSTRTYKTIGCVVLQDNQIIYVFTI